MLDKHYTPSFVAAAMIKAVSAKFPNVIADFAAGHGELLRHATERWPDAQIVANDIDPDAVRHLRRSRQGWTTSHADFLNSAARDFALQKHAGHIDLILLNPPFSCRGARVHCVTYQGLNLRCSPALAFVIASLQFLSITGQLITVVPCGSLRSEKDQEAWSVLKASFDIDGISDFGRETFPGCAVKSAIIRVRRLAEHAPRCLNGVATPEFTDVKIRRGTLQVHRASLSRHRSRGALPFIHSTTLRNNVIEQLHWTKSDLSVVTGPAVLLPRVGRPDYRKIAMLPSSESVVLSDCVFAIYCKSDHSTAALKATLIENWQVVHDAYGGTCAPYLTLAELHRVLARVTEGMRAENRRVVAKD